MFIRVYIVNNGRHIAYVVVS
eukprot:COSAG02_NODE_60133_length_272_cov_0.601156_1_plen_20_part_10